MEGISGQWFTYKDILGSAVEMSDNTSGGEKGTFKHKLLESMRNL